MKNVFCKTGRIYGVKKIVSQMSEMPSSAEFKDEAYCEDGIYSIYRTPNGILYAKRNRVQP